MDGWMIRISLVGGHRRNTHTKEKGKEARESECDG